MISPGTRRILMSRCEGFLDTSLTADGVIVLLTQVAGMMYRADITFGDEPPEANQITLAINLSVPGEITRV